MATKRNPRLSAALEYASRGWLVFPCYSITAEGTCSCPRPICGDPGKHPRTKNGFKNASTDPEIIRGWWTTWPDANVAIATGEKSNLYAFDVDPRNDGDKSLSTLVAQHGPLPKTLTATTGGKGKHFAFTSEQSLPSVKRVGGKTGLDFKGRGGYIVVDPSNHISGGTYRWGDLSVPPAPIPKWLANLVRGSKVKPSNPANPATAADDDFMSRVLQGVPEGERNQSLFEYAVRLRRQSLKSDEATLLLLYAASACKPPLSEKEVKKILASAWKESTGEVKISWSTARDLLAEKIVPPRSFVGTGLIPERSFTLLYGVPGIRKSWLVMDMMLCISRGESFLNLPTTKTRVGLLELELPKAVVQDRLRKLAGETDDGLELPFFACKDSIKGRIDLADPRTISLLTRMCSDTGVELLFIDALSRAHTRDENSAVDFAPVLNGIAELNENGIAVVAVHHEQKRGKWEIGDLEAIRGTSRLSSDPTTCLRLKKTRNGGEVVALVAAKISFGVEPPIIYLKPHPDGYLEITTAPKAAQKAGDINRNKIERLFEQAGQAGLFVDEIIAKTELSQETVYRHIKSLGATKGKDRRFRLPK